MDNTFNRFLSATMRYFLFLFIFLLHFVASAQVFDIDKWKSFPLPTNEDTLLAYNHSKYEWNVFELNGTIKAIVERREQFDTLAFEFRPRTFKDSMLMKGKRIVQQVEDGFLVSFWRGEFGGSLYWFDKHGAERKFIARTMIVQFLERDKRLFAISGLAHMGMSSGAILELTKSDSGWSVKPFVTLPFAPYAATFDKEKNFIVVTSDNLLRIDINKEIKPLIAKGFWRRLYPNSAIMEGNILYVGMRQGILKYNLEASASSWLMPR